MSSVTVAFSGWNSSTQGWGSGGWGEDIALPNAAGSVGTVTVDAEANAPVTGLSATGSVGSVLVTAVTSVFVTGCLLQVP